MLVPSRKRLYDFFMSYESYADTWPPLAALPEGVVAHAMQQTRTQRCIDFLSGEEFHHRPVNTYIAGADAILGYEQREGLRSLAECVDRGMGTTGNSLATGYKWSLRHLHDRGWIDAPSDLTFREMQNKWLYPQPEIGAERLVGCLQRLSSVARHSTPDLYEAAQACSNELTAIDGLSHQPSAVGNPVNQRKRKDLVMPAGIGLMVEEYRDLIRDSERAVLKTWADDSGLEKGEDFGL